MLTESTNRPSKTASSNPNETKMILVAFMSPAYAVEMLSAV